MLNTFIKEHCSLVEKIVKIEAGIKEFIRIAINTFEKGNKIIVFGNGGSAADAQHMAAELVGRFKKERSALPAIALTTDTSILTSVANDYTFEEVFTRQVAGLAREGDLVLGLSTSGNSLNVYKALEKAKAIGCTTAALLGKDGGCIKSIVDMPLVVASDNTARVQECHIFIIHMICELIENGVEV